MGWLDTWGDEYPRTGFARQEQASYHAGLPGQRKADPRPKVELVPRRFRREDGEEILALTLPGDAGRQVQIDAHRHISFKRPLCSAQGVEWTYYSGDGIREHPLRWVLVDDASAKES